MKGSAGFTIIEVMIAIAIFGVGIIAAASLQANALNWNSRARLIQEVTNAARVEIEMQRQAFRLRPNTATAPFTCLSGATPLPGLTCEVTIVPCRLWGTPRALSCSTAVSTNAVIGDQITVRVTGPRTAMFEAQTIISRPPLVTTGAQ